MLCAPPLLLLVHDGAGERSVPRDELSFSWVPPPSSSSHALSAGSTADGHVDEGALELLLELLPVAADPAAAYAKAERDKEAAQEGEVRKLFPAETLVNYHASEHTLPTRMVAAQKARLERLKDASGAIAVVYNRKAPLLSGHGHKHVRRVSGRDRQGAPVRLILKRFFSYDSTSGDEIRSTVAQNELLVRRHLQELAVPVLACHHYTAEDGIAVVDLLMEEVEGAVSLTVMLKRALAVRNMPVVLHLALQFARGLLRLCESNLALVDVNDGTCLVSDLLELFMSASPLLLLSFSISSSPPVDFEAASVVNAKGIVANVPLYSVEFAPLGLHDAITGWESERLSNEQVAQRFDELGMGLSSDAYAFCSILLDAFAFDAKVREAVRPSLFLSPILLRWSESSCSSEPR